jgi:uroporphyrinogen decarboxylase
MVVEELGSSVPVIQTVFSPLTVAGYLVGEERLEVAGELRERREPLSEALERIADALADFAVRSVTAGAAGIFYAISGFASAGVLSEDEYRALALPHDRRVLEAVPDGAWLNVLHLCGPRIHFGLASALDVDAVSWSVHEPGNPSLAEGRERSGRAVMGGLDQAGALVSGSPDEVLAQGRTAVAETEGAGLLLAPGCSVPPHAPDENLRAVMRSATGP